VKTRLATAIGDKAACDAYRQLTETILAKLTPMPHVELRFTPDDAEAEMKSWLRKDWAARPQGEGDLGQRMLRAFAEANGSAIIIGSDCPCLELNDLEAAAEALQTHDAVLGPAVDGGYWLIGLNVPCPALFEGIEWSTDAVLKTTISKAELQGLLVCQLRELSDVDTVEDWSGWRESNSRYDLTSEMLKYPPK
jgi:rSAM/selenodomain-associated transferase 1